MYFISKTLKLQVDVLLPIACFPALAHYFDCIMYDNIVKTITLVEKLPKTDQLGNKKSIFNHKYYIH